ncbi:NAD(P)/FAD-dependent oxidoreductase [Azospirillum picis]|uniref:Thioredoxin reductase n=1 Tax=Azospirillum picis TaxID=488438 RepID=A0ABU0MIL7_9PROT|nr:NAD(P)/FAD-dependent oxidoreductase [Azospirillum picis]MBP2299567.1 thioredoxin reductase [Azospirillum picis]MDQ0533306.1 thioredoxin reductase [Azospirillum picis]
MIWHAIVVGGSYAGLAAALQLARARRSVLVIDEGVRRNRFAHKSHGFLGQDGRPPAEIAAEARRQLMLYRTVTWQAGRAERADAGPGGFSVVDGAGARYDSLRLILATGVQDHLPPIPGLAERWGRSAFHCPYCHGYELNQGRIGVIAVSPLSMHHALMLPDWGATTLLLNGAFEPDAGQSAELARRGVTVEAGTIRSIGGTADLSMDDGRLLSFDGLFVMPRTSAASPLAAQLGCALQEGPLGPYIETDPMQETSVPGVFACGDAARAAGSVTFAVSDGAQAGVALHRSLIFGGNGLPPAPPSRS